MPRQNKLPVPLFALAAFLFLANLRSTQIPSCVTEHYSYHGALGGKKFQVRAPTNNTTDNLPDPGLKALIDLNYPTQRISKAAPERLYLIYGLESSGTTFVARTISTALGITKKLSLDTVESLDHTTHIQHLSLPLGASSHSSNKLGLQRRQQQKESEVLSIVPVYYPTGCRVGSQDPPTLVPVPLECQEILGDQVVMTPPHRYFVNITSHVQWYRERGVRVYPIMVVRDPMLHFEGILAKHPGHCRDPVAAYQQYEQGRAIMAHAIHGGMVQPVIVSYESLLTLQDAYLLHHVYYQLGINSSYIPKFRNGNTLKLYKAAGRQTGELELAAPAGAVSVVEELLKEDGSHPDPDGKLALSNLRRPNLKFLVQQSKMREERRAGPHGNVSLVTKNKRPTTGVTTKLQPSGNRDHGRNHTASSNTTTGSSLQQQLPPLEQKSEASIASSKRFQAITAQRLQDKDDTKQLQEQGKLKEVQ
jgi:hypothetical protein